MLCLLKILVLSVNIYLSQGQLFLTSNLPWWRMVDRSRDSGDRLLLTGLLESGDDYSARRASRVDEKYFLGVVSYSGYLTVDEKHESNLFFWYFPAQGTEHLYEEDQKYDDSDNDDHDDYYSNTFQTKSTNHDSPENDDNRPVVLWLQGGPGSSSLFGLFTENGPFFINEDKISIRKNPYSWHTKYNILFIDNPVGTGFSFTDASGYCQNITQVAKHLYLGLRQFFQLFPWLASNPFYITGESFAGKYIPAIGFEINERNKIEDFQINLQGLALGNALSDPYNMLNYGDYAYQTGLVDKHGWRQMKIFEYLAKEHVNDAYGKIYWDAQLYAFVQASNYSNVYNILEPNALEFDPFALFMNQPHIRKAVHVGDQEFASSTTVYYNLTPDFMTTAMHWTEKLLNEGLRIMYYSGNMDVIVAYPLSEEAYSRMKWNGIDAYRSACRNPFYVNDTLHGYVKKANNFYDVLILNAGHMVPTDQPVAALTLLNRFIDNTL
ncbi:venom serine carboxypeptidase-like isoform X2 [Bradysia coprophila]|uniref:venom serine carboxypeptidase-like isoform X2 n=1 Tax=Bradysia coprophila TaxID=38358 RepID=UPI00187D87F8|nr:venom serine carboxypeptidase-like isoform X2 [Bradysia coprophila]